MNFLVTYEVNVKNLGSTKGINVLKEEFLMFEYHVWA